MKKIIWLVALVALFSGCASMDAKYEKGKETYVAGKAVVKVIPKDPVTEDTLGVVDWFAETYDTARTWIRGEDDNVSGN